MADFAVFQIEITKGYDMSAFREAVHVSWGRQLAISGEFYSQILYLKTLYRNDH